MYKKILFTLLVFVVTVVGQKQNEPQRLPTPPEANQTIDALQGVWHGRVTAKVPGFPVDIFDWTMDCKVTARGAGLLCTGTGTGTGLNRIH